MKGTHIPITSEFLTLLSENIDILDPQELEKIRTVVASINKNGEFRSHKMIKSTLFLDVHFVFNLVIEFQGNNEVEVDMSTRYVRVINSLLEILSEEHNYLILSTDEENNKFTITFTY